MTELDHLSQSPTSEWRTNHWGVSERLFTLLGAAIAFGLFGRSGLSAVALAATGVLAAYAIAVTFTSPASRLRLMTNYLAVWSLYSGSSNAIDALRLPLHHEQLLTWDRALFGETPGVAWQGLAPPWLNDLLSAGYLSYHVYLHWLLVEALWRSEARRLAYSRVLFTAFGIGFIGYFLFPAGDPRVAFSESFRLPVAGGWMTQFNHWIVGNLAARYDAFPSLHILVTTTMLVCDWRWNRARLCWMLVPSMFMVASTLLLRLHFAVDLLAGAVLAVGVLALVRVHEIRIDD